MHWILPWRCETATFVGISDPLWEKVIYHLLCSHLIGQVEVKLLVWTSLFMLFKVGRPYTNLAWTKLSRDQASSWWKKWILCQTFVQPSSAAPNFLPKWTWLQMLIHLGANDHGIATFVCKCTRTKMTRDYLLFHYDISNFRFRKNIFARWTDSRVLPWTPAGATFANWFSTGALKHWCTKFLGAFITMKLIHFIRF